MCPREKVESKYSDVFSPPRLNYPKPGSLIIAAQQQHSLPQRHLPLRRTWVQTCHQWDPELWGPLWFLLLGHYSRLSCLTAFGRWSLVPPLPETSASKAGLKPLVGAHGTHNLWSHTDFYWSPGLGLLQRAWAPGRNRVKAQRQNLSLALTSEACELEHNLRVGCSTLYTGVQLWRTLPFQNRDCETAASHLGSFPRRQSPTQVAQFSPGLIVRLWNFSGVR